MCGIFGCISNNKLIDITKLIVDALNLLKNRGYDSCGIYLNNEELNEIIIKFGIDGEIIKNNEFNTNDIFILLEKKVSSIENSLSYNIGIGHTRWATHGGKTDFNSHPHTSNNGLINIVHNGIISNYEELKKKYLQDYKFYSNTDTEVIVNMIQYFKNSNNDLSMIDILKLLTELLEGTWACIIHDKTDVNKLYFMKNESPLLIGTDNENLTMFTSEPSGFLNKIDNYILLREKTYGYINKDGIKNIYGDFKELKLIKSQDNEIKLPINYKNWMMKEIHDQINLSVLVDPITNNIRYNDEKILLNFDFIKECKYLFIIACGSSYYAGLIASNYFRFTKAFEFINVIDGGEFTKTHLEAIKNPERDLLIILISQSGETRDLNLATTICREFSSNRKLKLKSNKLLNDDEFNINTENEKNNLSGNDEIKILGIINVMGSLISRRTIDNFFTNCGRENAVASTKSCTSQIISCLLLAIYKSELNGNLSLNLRNNFLSDLTKLQNDIKETIQLDKKIEFIAKEILNKNKKSLFLLGKDELFGSALEGALKIKEIAYIHAEGFNISALKHGPYALIEKDTPIIIIYKTRDHFIKSIIEEIKTRGAIVIELSPFVNEEDNLSIKINFNKTFTGLLSVVVLQLLSYHLSILQNLDPDRPRNLAKVVTVD